MVARYTTAAAAAAVYPGVVNLPFVTGYGCLAFAIVVPLSVESGANREEKTYIEGVRTILFFAFVTIAALAAAAAAAAASLPQQLPCHLRRPRHAAARRTRRLRQPAPSTHIELDGGPRGGRGRGAATALGTLHFTYVEEGGEPAERERRHSPPSPPPPPPPPEPPGEDSEYT